MLCRSLYLLLLLASSSYEQQLNNTALDIQYPQGFESDALTWTEAKRNSCAISGEREVSCSLPAGVIVLRVDVDRVKLQCEKSFACREMSEVPSYVANYTHTANIQTFTIDSCVLPDEEISCVLNLLGVTDVRMLIFKNLKSNLEERHLAGLEMITDLDIRGLDSSITKIPYDALSTLPKLNKLNIQYAVLNLENDTGAILSVERLSLIDSTLKVIPDGAFKRMPYVNNLIIIGDRSGLKIEKQAFYDLPRLVNISLNTNKILFLPEGVFSQNKLIQNIDIYSNDLRALNASVFSGLTRLTEINIYSNRETLHLDGGVFSNLPSLKLVDIHDTQIDNVPANLFFNSTNIKTIDMSYCKVTILPDNLFLNLNLEYLDISNNDIYNLPSTMLQGQKKLTDLNLSNNNISVLPDAIFSSLTKLEILNVDNNNIEYLNEFVFQSLRNLKKLYLNGNKLKSLPLRTFDPLRHLQVLSVSNNAIVDYSEATPYLLELTSLDLSKNNITTVYDVFIPLVYLQDLDLSYNQIMELDRINFDNRTRIDLRHNNISYVDLLLQPDKSPDSLPNLFLDYNPYNCTCSLYNFITLTSNKSYSRIHINNAKCSTPNDLSGHKLADLSVDMLTCDYSLCPDGCNCLERIAKKQYEFTCNSMPDFKEIFRSPSDIILRLENYTSITHLPASVKLLNLSGLNISNFEPVLSNPIEIDLSNNSLTAAPTLLQKNFTLNLLNNPLKCDCEHKDSVTLMKKFNKNIKYYSKLTCDNGDYVETKDIDQICSLQGQVTYSLLALAIVCFFTVVLAVIYKNIGIIRVLLRKYGFNFPEDLGDYDFDAFMSFAHEDEVLVDKIVKKLESGPSPLKLCVHTRNWIPGEVIVDQIERSVERSRWTIIVLSRNFVKSYWAKIEYLTAHSKNKLLLLIIDDVHLLESLSPEIKLYIKSTTYTHYSNPYAIELLRDAVLRKPKWSKIVKEKKENNREIKDVGKSPLDVHINVDGQLVNKGETLKL